METARLLLQRAALALAGAVVCVAALVAHRHLWSPFGVDLPWGLVLAIGTTFLVVRAAALLDGTPAGAACCAAGWAAVLLLLFGGRAEGDYLVAADWVGYSMAGGGIVASGAGVVVALAGPRPSPTPTRHSI